jgi:hypothetical protein
MNRVAERPHECCPVSRFAKALGEAQASLRDAFIEFAICRALKRPATIDRHYATKGVGPALLAVAKISCGYMEQIGMQSVHEAGHVLGPSSDQA